MPPNPHVSKLVVERERVATSVGSAFRTHAPVLTQTLDATLTPFLAEGERAPDFALVLRLVERALAGATGTMTAADLAHFAEKADDAEVISARDAAAAAFGKRVVQIRTTFTENFGTDFGGRLGISGPTPTDPALLYAFGRTFIDAIERAPLPTTTVTDGLSITIDKATLLATLRELHGALKRALGHVADEVRELEGTQRAKDQGIQAHDRMVAFASTLAEAGLLLADMPDAAGRVRGLRRGSSGASGDDGPVTPNDSPVTPADT